MLVVVANELVKCSILIFMSDVSDSMYTEDPALCDALHLMEQVLWFWSAAAPLLCSAPR